jgi:hypothetical protein
MDIIPEMPGLRLMLRYINSNEFFFTNIPRTLFELQKVENELNLKGDTVTLYYEKYSSDPRNEDDRTYVQGKEDQIQLIEIKSFKIYKESFNTFDHITGQAVVILVKKEKNESNQSSEQWVCRRCMYKNLKTDPKCKVCQNERPSVQGSRKILD